MRPEKILSVILSEKILSVIWYKIENAKAIKTDLEILRFRPS